MRASLRSLLAIGVALGALGTAAAGQIQQTLDAPKLRIDNVVGDITINVVPGVSGIEIGATGDDRFTSLLSIAQSGDTAEIRMGDVSYNSGENLQTLKLTITLAPGTDVGIEDLVGDATVGDLQGPIAIEAVAGKIAIGRATSVSVESSGSADVTVAEASGSLSIETAGSGKVKVGRAGPTAISISGSGDAAVEQVSGSLGIEIDGSADVRIGQVDGPVAISISGSGDVAIAGGRANPFAAETSGSGSILFAGTAVNPRVSSSGSGDVCIGKAEGAIQSDGAITIDPAACKRS